VDSGVDANPDTTPGLIGSYAIDNGASDDVDPCGHGTTPAMIAGGAGKGILGARPQLKIVSVCVTNIPSAGQEPAYEFDNYTDGMQYCLSAPLTDHIKAVDLALASQIPPAVGADTAQPGTFSAAAAGVVCSFSADQGITLYAPACGLDGADPFSDQPYCCEDGTSQASAFTAAVIVAMMSYDPTLTYSRAENLLTQPANDGDLDVAAAFEADGLGQIVTAGNANTPPALHDHDRKTGVLAGGGASAAAAGSPGTYTITACSPSTSAGGWTQVNQVPAAMSAGNMCGGTSALGPNETITDSGATRRRQHRLRAHNASIVAAYLDHRDLAALEGRAERYFLNVVLLRVLYAHALVAAPRLALGHLAPLGRVLGDPRLGMTGAFLSLGRVVPHRYPLSDDLEVYIRDERGIGRLLDYAVFGTRLERLYGWAAQELNQSDLSALVRDGTPPTPGHTTSGPSGTSRRCQ
jgi:hypothetical protein